MIRHLPLTIIGICALTLAALAGCTAQPNVNPNSVDTPSYAASATRPATPVSETSSSAVADTASATGTPSLLPYVKPTNGSPPVLMNEDGPGILIFGMTIAQFYTRAAELGWKCNPAKGADPELGAVRSPAVGISS